MSSAPERPSRQDLVVPPRQSGLPVFVGAVACGCLGFAMVWALGVGRDVPAHDPLEPAETVESAAADRWLPRDPDRPPAHVDPQVQPSSLDQPQPLESLRPLSRFTRESQEIPVGEPEPPAPAPVGEAPLADEAPTTPPARLALPPAEEMTAALDAGHAPSDAETINVDAPLNEAEPVAPEATSAPDLEAAPDAAPPGDADARITAADAGPPPTGDAPPPSLVLPDDAAAEPVAEAEPPAAPATAPAAADLPPAEPPAAAPGPLAAAGSTAPPDLSVPVDEPEPPAPDAPEPPADLAADAPDERPAEPEAAATPDQPHARSRAVVAAPAPPAAAATSPAPAPSSPAPWRARPPAASPPPPATLPFAAAPPIGPPASAGPALDDAPVPAGAGHGDAGNVADVATRSGQGRPGPMQLEGLQSPQLAVEKRGPREVQVGKPARYEILVRNVGSVTAHDVTLRDSVPYGTTLVTTTPPAAPARSATGAEEDELLWNLGALDPGGQARVVVELMPQAEGEIGSVASVTFRADASVRSRATKPALAITCNEPDPVRIGGDAGLTITVTNPGSGVATGVVVEGFLPENVSHRSGSELEFDVGRLEPGASRTIELVLGTRGPGVHTARLAARADGGIEAQQAVKLEVTAPTLELEVDMPVRRFLQRPATCAISMVNAGTAPARSIELAAQLPPGMKFVRANNAGWHDDRTHRVLWNLEELPAGETGTVEVVVMPVDAGPQKIVAAARSTDGLAHQVAHVCEVEGLAALSFEVVDSEDPIEVEGLTEYVVRVGNQGTKPATGVRLAATLLGDLEPVGAEGPSAHRVENLTVAFEPLAKLAPAEEAVFRIRARGRAAGDHRVQVHLTSEDHPAPITKEEVTRVYADR